VANAKLGVAWSESVKDAPERRYYRALLDLGVLGSLPCRIVENAKRANEKAPTHLVFFSPLTGGEDLRVGALWPYKHPDTGAEYLTGHLDLGSLGLVELKGGAKVDLRLVKDSVAMRLSEARERARDRSPTHELWRMTDRAKRKGGASAGTVSSGGDAGEDSDGDDIELAGAA
jgi:uncharacterized protein (DUF736 family)